MVSSVRTPAEATIERIVITGSRLIPATEIVIGRCVNPPVRFLSAGATFFHWASLPVGHPHAIESLRHGAAGTRIRESCIPGQLLLRAASPVSADARTLRHALPDQIRTPRNLLLQGVMTGRPQLSHCIETQV